MGQVLFSDMKIFPLGGVQGAPLPSVKLGPPHISETTRARKFKFYTHLDGAKYFSGVKIFPVGCAGGVAPPSVNLGPPQISESIIARNLKFYVRLDRAKYSFQV